MQGGRGSLGTRAGGGRIFRVRRPVSEGEQMKGAHALGAVDLPARCDQRGAHQIEVEDVVMQAAVGGVALRADAEIIHRAGPRIAAQVVQREDLGEMREVVLAGAVGQVGLQMGQRGDRAPVVEGAGGVGEEQHQGAAGANDAAPFREGGEGIGDVLQAMRGKNEIVGGTRHTVEIGGLTEELAPGGPTGIEAEFSAVAQVGLPGGDAGEVHVVDAAGAGVDRQELPAGEDRTGPTDFEARAPDGRGEDGRAEGGLGRPEAVVDGRGERARVGVAEPAQEKLKAGKGGHAGFLPAGGGGGEDIVRTDGCGCTGNSLPKWFSQTYPSKGIAALPVCPGLRSPSPYVRFETISNPCQRL